MDIILKKIDHGAQPESEHGVTGPPHKDIGGGQSFSDLPNKQHTSSNTELAEELDLASALGPLSGWRFATIAFM
jgi:hypothetical protein